MSHIDCYDYGRPRELHLDDGIAVSKLEEYAIVQRPSLGGPGRYGARRWTLFQPDTGELQQTTFRHRWLCGADGSCPCKEGPSLMAVVQLRASAFFSSPRTNLLLRTRQSF